MVVTALCLTFVVFWLTNLAPNLEKVAKSEAGSRITYVVAPMLVSTSAPN